MGMPVGSKSKTKGKGIGGKRKRTALQIANDELKQARATGEGQVVFQLLGGSERTHIVKTRTTAIENGRRVAIRYIPGVTTVDESEQNNVDLTGIRMRAIVFRDGKIVVSEETMKEFLRRHPGNSKNGGSTFYEYNAVAEAQSRLDRELALDEAKYMAAKGLTDEQAYQMARRLRIQNIDVLDMSEIRMFLRAFASRDPERFNELSGNPENEIYNIVYQSMADRVTEIRKAGKEWGYKNGGKILDLPPSDEPVKIDHIVRWLMSDKAGAEVLEALKA